MIIARRLIATRRNKPNFNKEIRLILCFIPLEPRERNVVDLDGFSRFDTKCSIDLSTVILPMQQNLRKDVPNGSLEWSPALIRIVDHLIQLGFLERFDI